MKQFFTHIKNSIYGPAYYRELLTKPFSYSWKYFSTLSFFIALFLTMVTSLPLIPLVQSQLYTFPEKFFAYYPDELEVRIEKGIVSTNVSEPYFLPLPTIIKEEFFKDSPIAAFAVIDTKTPFSLEQFRAYNTATWLGVNQVAMYDQNGGISTQSIGTNSNAVVNETALRNFEQALRPYYKFVSPLLVLVIFIGLLLALWVNIVYLLIGALLIMVLLRVMNRRVRYAEAYRIGLHAITFPIFLNALSTLLGFPLSTMPFLFSAVTLAIVYLNFEKEGALRETATPAGSTQSPDSNTEQTG